MDINKDAIAAMIGRFGCSVLLLAVILAAIFSILGII